MSFRSVRTYDLPSVSGTSDASLDANSLLESMKKFPEGCLEAVAGNCVRLGMDYAELYRHGAPLTRDVNLREYALSSALSFVRTENRVDLVRVVSAVRRAAEPYMFRPSMKRAELAQVCNERGYKHAVEVGLDRGVFATEFMEAGFSGELYCVDNYSPYYCTDRSADLMMALLSLQRWYPRVRVIIDDSVAAAAAICSMPPNISPDFVYIDAAHDYARVLLDIRTWWEVLAPGGMMAGHDYSLPDVKRAVHEVFSRVEVITGNSIPSWVVFK